MYFVCPPPVYPDEWTEFRIAVRAAPVIGTVSSFTVGFGGLVNAVEPINCPLSVRSTVRASLPLEFAPEYPCATRIDAESTIDPAGIAVEGVKPLIVNDVLSL